MVTSDTEIGNSALIKLGAERVISLDDDSVRARLVKEQYPKLRDYLLRSHPWKFARERASLAVVDPVPANFYDYLYVFQLPADCLRVLETDLLADDPWVIEGRFLAANTSSVTIKYIKKVVDVTLFDDNFCEVLAWLIASDIAYALTQSTARAESAKANYREELTTARSYNAQQGSVQRVVADDWLNSRY